MKSLFAIVLFLSAGCLYAQNVLKGKVIDAQTKAPLAFVNIVVEGELKGTTTDIDGKFTIEHHQPIKQLHFSYVGYEKKTVNITNNNYLVVELKATAYQIKTFEVLPGENPAHKIIKKVVENRKKHHPEKSINFKYDSYNKFVVTANIDSALLNNPEKINELDTNDQEFIKFLDKHYIFLMESVTERKFMLPDKSYEKVIASRVSGLKNPTFSILATELQSFSFYDPLMNIGSHSYLNPISVGSTNKYLFIIEDTTYTGNDSVFVISFRPKKGKNFEGLKGVLYINTSGYALQNVIAEPYEEDEGISIKIQQKYQKIGDHWFPEQLNTFLIFNNAQINNFKLYGISRSYLKNIVINPDTLSKKDFTNVAVEIKEDATKKDEDFWNKYRVDTLNEREKNTYHFIDSIGEKNHFDQKLKWFETLMTGRLNWGIIDFDINRIIDYNDYEGIRLGAGIFTSKKVSKWMNVGAYSAYGFKDKAIKYGGEANFFIQERNEIALRLFYQNDVVEPGSFTFFEPPRVQSSENLRKIYISRKNEVETFGMSGKFRTLRYLKVYPYVSYEYVKTTNDYVFYKKDDLLLTAPYKDFTFNEIGVGLRYAYKEKVAKSLSKQYALGTKYPVVYAKISQGTSFYEGTFNYTRVTVKTDKTFKIKNIGRPSFSLSAGSVIGNIPYYKLFNFNGVFTPNKFALSIDNSFETMLPYEFIADQFFAFHFRHSFGSLLLKAKRFEPELIIRSSVGVGSLSNRYSHQNITFNVPEKGYFESGLQINNLLKMNFSGFGVGVFYRYGPYAFSESIDNLAIKMTFGYVF
jgi:hypothetical protein